MRETSAQKRDKLYEALLAEKARRAAAQHDYDWRNVCGCKLPQGRGEGQCDKHARPEQIAPDWSWRTWLILAGRGWGKLLDHATLLPTPSGWTTMGDVQVGDELFDESGRPCRVTAKYSPPIEQAYRIRFSDGAEIIADAGHQWVTWTHAERKAFLRSPYESTTRFPEEWPTWRLKRRLGHDLSRERVAAAMQMSQQGMSARGIERQLGVCRGALAKHLRFGAFVERPPVVHADAPGPRIRTTQEIADTLRYGSRGDLNHCIPTCRPLDLPAVELPIPPYTLGVWLGDGSAADGTITAHEADMPFLRSRIEADGFGTSSRSDPQSLGTGGLYARLRLADLLHNKHVPSVYLRASIAQRLALLRGLMDTDGNIETGNTVAFVNTNEALVKAVVELVHSLGMKTRLWSGIGKCNGKAGERFWRVQFTSTVVPFLMPRKAGRVVLDGQQSLRNHHRMIVAVEPVEQRPMSCITVDSPHSMYLCGREMIPTHNTRTGAEWVREQVKTSKYVNLVGATADDARDIQIEGETGLLQICPKGERPVYLPSKRRLEWPNGAVSLIFTADEPERMRGKQHEKLWLDELAAWKYPESYDQAMLGLRLGQRPQVVITTTPKPTRLIKEIRDNPTTHVTRGTTYDNRANLAPEFFADIVKKYEGTRMGRQELNAEILTDNPNALWSRDVIDKGRIQPGECPKLARVVVAIDPAVTSNEDSDLTGIVVVGKFKDECFVLEDCSLSASPDAWAKRAIRAYTQHEADRIVAETNNGGDLVEAVLRTVNRSVPYRKVHASRGKQIRAEPVAALYEQGKVHHVGSLPMLEDEMCDYDPTLAQKSPDRMDALVWAVSELTQGPTRSGHVTELRI